MVQQNTKTTVKFDICPNGCHMYPLNDPESKKCPLTTCQAPRYCNESQVEAARDDIERDEAMPLPELIPTRQLAYTSIGKALTELYVNESNADMLAYGSEVIEQHREDIDMYRDIFSGACYQHLLANNDLDVNTICLVVFVDGYQLKNMQKAHQVLINCLVMNIHPEHR